METVLLERTATGLAPMSRSSGGWDFGGNAMVPTGRARGNVSRDNSGGRSNICGAEVCSSRGSELDSEIKKECPEANATLLWPAASSVLTPPRAIFQEICRHPAGTCQIPLRACPFSGLPSQTGFSTCDSTKPEATPRSANVVLAEGSERLTDTASTWF